MEEIVIIGGGIAAAYMANSILKQAPTSMRDYVHLTSMPQLHGTLLLKMHQIFVVLMKSHLLVSHLPIPLLLLKCCV